MDKRTHILPLMFLILLSCSSCVEMEKADETWESPGPIKVRIVLKYSLGNDYYFFEAHENKKGRWKRIMGVWRDATGAIPVENVRILNRIPLGHDGFWRHLVGDMTRRAQQRLAADGAIACLSSNLIPSA